MPEPPPPPPALYIGTGWHGRYHIIGNTYGTWLHGDPKGFRTLHHREYIDGDYKHPPPPGKYEHLYRRSLSLMSRDAVNLTPEARGIACRMMAAAMQYHHIELLVISDGAKHYHAVARFPCTPQWCQLLSSLDPKADGLQSVGFHRFDRTRRKSALDDPPRHYIGIAKKRAARALSDAGLVPPGGAFAKRCHVVPIEDRAHQLQAVPYVRDHYQEGAAVLLPLGKPLDPATPFYVG